MFSLLKKPGVEFQNGINRSLSGARRCRRSRGESCQKTGIICADFNSSVLLAFNGASIVDEAYVNGFILECKAKGKLFSPQTVTKLEETRIRSLSLQLFGATGRVLKTFLCLFVFCNGYISIRVVCSQKHTVIRCVKCYRSCSKCSKCFSDYSWASQATLTIPSAVFIFTLLGGVKVYVCQSHYTRMLITEVVWWS